MTEKIDVEKLLEEGHAVRLAPQGLSMYPLFVPGRDYAVIAPLNNRKIRRGDVVLYRRDQSILVLHRVWRVTGKGIFFVGDNQTNVEGPLRPDQMRGILSSVIRGGKEIKVTHPLYVIISRLWLLARPLRGIYYRIKNAGTAV